MLKELPTARYAHLATHGFFNAADLTEERERLAKQIEGLKGYMAPRRGTTEFGGVALRSSLVYTGLVLAGANVPMKGGPDGGVLTGEALIELPLEGMRLCVLSASETGLGAYTQDEGVQGLVRAFHLAGCRDVIASLWKVDDAATAALMNLFYTELWDNKKSPLEALALAQRELSRHPERIPELSGQRGAGDPSKAAKGIDTPPPPVTYAAGERLHPKLWAAFQLYGASR